jgi:oligoribonuclease
MNIPSYLVWIDLEMSGLNPETDVILEIATIITDNNLNEIAIGPSLVIGGQPINEHLMNPIVKEMHTTSGLLKAVDASSTSLDQAQINTLAFIAQWCAPQTGLLCGNSVWQDRLFLQKYMPKIVQYLHYRLIDVTTIKEVVARWYPNNSAASFKKKSNHRAIEDIRESIAELAYYKKYFFNSLA